MRLSELIAVVDEGYGDDRIALAHAGEDCGDGLAAFIARELADTFDEEASDAKQISTALSVIEGVREDLDRVVGSLSEAGFNLALVDDEDWQDEVNWEEIEIDDDEPSGINVDDEA